MCQPLFIGGVGDVVVQRHAQVSLQSALHGIAGPVHVSCLGQAVEHHLVQVVLVVVGGSVGPAWQVGHGVLRHIRPDLGRVSVTVEVGALWSRLRGYGAWKLASSPLPCGHDRSPSSGSVRPRT